ncbi:MAG: hypothetical protein KFF68_07235, partial [Desulfosarcina sp.]|nr:hypothetical protein [Desulfosarcina sp.]
MLRSTAVTGSTFPAACRGEGSIEIQHLQKIIAESYLDEQQYIEKQQKSTAASSRSKNQDTQIRPSIIRCEKLKGDAALAAC